MSAQVMQCMDLAHCLHWLHAVAPTHLVCKHLRTTRVTSCARAASSARHLLKRCFVYLPPPDGGWDIEWIRKSESSRECVNGHTNIVLHIYLFRVSSMGVL
jgi:hypothetical protein